MGLLTALRYAPHVPLDDGDDREHGEICTRVMMLEMFGHRFNVVKLHWVMAPVIAQVHLVMVPGQRG